eukprot:4350305-Prymnesium_polylepis.1
MRAHGAGACSRKGVGNRRGPMEWPHSDRRKNDPPRVRDPPTGPRDEQSGCRPPARGAFKWRWVWAILGEGHVRLPY